MPPPPADPAVTVLMCVHDGERFLRQAVDSVLAQTFADFELLVIDDGSADASPQILASYGDPRLRVVRQRNRGLTAALNRGIGLARGALIARMDADDVSLPQRLERQVALLDARPDIAVCATRVVLIDAQGAPAGEWPADAQNLTPEQIRAALPRGNCLAHSSVMIRAEVLRRFGYDERQRHSQDWDLWLRLSQHGLRFAKLPEALVQLRMHGTTITAATNRELGAFKTLELRRRFLLQRLRARELNGYTARVLSAYADAERRLLRQRLRRGAGRLRGSAAAVVSLLRQRAVWRRLARRLDPARPLVLLMYHSLSSGGAEKVLLDIAEGLRGDYQLVMLASESDSDAWRARFEQACDAVVSFARSLPEWARREALLSLAVALQPALVIFSNAPLAARSLGALKARLPRLKAVDILHSDKGLEARLLPDIVPLLDRRVAISRRLRSALRHAYRDAQLERYDDRLATIYNGVDVERFQLRAPAPDFKARHGIAERQLVTFIGRLDWDKDPLLFLELAARSRDADRAFALAGAATLHPDCAAAVRARAEQIPRVYLLGPLAEVEALLAVSDALVITSPWEGIPIVAAEAMACGVPVVAPDVGALREIVDHGVDGLLYERAGDAAAAACAQLDALLRDPERHAALSAAARRKIEARFSMRQFQQRYRELVRALLAER